MEKKASQEAQTLAQLELALLIAMYSGEDPLPLGALIIDVNLPVSYRN